VQICNSKRFLVSIKRRNALPLDKQHLCFVLFVVYFSVRQAIGDYWLHSQTVMNEAYEKEFLEYVVKSLVDNPDAVRVERTVDEMGVLLTLDIDAVDMGKIIGRSGNTAKAIRTLLRVVGMKNNSRVNLKINEPVGGLREATNGAPETSATDTADSVDAAIEELKA
jgi:predicted RNA-binding protein YlqC (UPF0109 family)